MLNECTLIVSIAAIIVSTVVPFVSVYFAQRLVRRDALRQTARETFLKVYRDVQDYYRVFLIYSMHLTHQSPGAFESAHELVGLIATLNDDRLLLGMIFGKKATSLAERVQWISNTAKPLLSTPPLPVSDYSELTKAVQTIGLEEMKPLWDSIQG